MEVVILILVIIGAIFAICSGVWVAIALIRAIFSYQDTTAAMDQTEKLNPDMEINRNSH